MKNILGKYLSLHKDPIYVFGIRRMMECGNLITLSFHGQKKINGFESLFFCQLKVMSVYNLGNYLFLGDVTYDEIFSMVPAPNGWKIKVEDNVDGTR